jgi:hypothetical protein
VRLFGPREWCLLLPTTGGGFRVNPEDVVTQVNRASMLKSMRRRVCVQKRPTWRLTSLHVSALCHKLTSTNIRKGNIMKPISCVLLLMASLAFVLMGCSENVAPVSGPGGQSTASSSSAVPLAKGGSVIHSVSGSSLLHFNDGNGTERIGTLTMAANLYEGGMAGGTYNWVTFTGKNYRADTKWGGHGVVKSVTMYPASSYGNAAVICGLERDDSSLPGKYLVWFVVDNGEGGNATAPDLCSEFVQSDSPDIATMTPEQIYALFPYFYVSEVGNLTIH